MLRRFEREWQSLGRLQHPGIAQIYEAGTADTGAGTQPYALGVILYEPERAAEWTAKLGARGGQ